MTAASASLPYRVRVVSSYIYDDKDESPYASMGRRNRWVNGFVSSLTRQKSGLREFDLGFERTPPTQEELRRLMGRYKEEGVRLIIVPGTDSAIRIAEVNQEIPILYFGAHPENNGMELLNHPNITGVRLNLPLVWTFKNFSLLKAIIPNLERVYFPLNWDSEFSFPNVKKNYELFMAKKQGFWVPGHSSNAGYRSIAVMAEWLGVEYFEGPYATIEQLQRGLDTVNPERSALVGFNDTVLKGAAVDTLLAFTRSKRVPLFWVNNAAIIKAAGVADFSSDFEAVGRLLATMALSMLRDGKAAKEIPFQDDPGEKLTLNLPGARALGLTPPPEAEVRFHEIFR